MAFTPLTSLAGGALIGLAASVLLALNGRIAGISGIVGGLVSGKASDRGWRLSFLGGLLTTGVLIGVFSPTMLERSIPALPFSLTLLAGLLVGVGTQLGSGCTSGHGVCGISRLSRRSFVATATFMVTGGLSAFVVQHLVLGGAR